MQAGKTGTGMHAEERQSSVARASRPGWRTKPLASLVLALLLTGCITRPVHVQSGDRITDIDPALAQPFHHWDQPPAVSVTATDYDKLWRAADEAARDLLFTVDRRDYRGGVLMTDPMVSGQIFEPWRGDAVTVRQRLESSIATVRRTIRFEFERHEDGTFSVAPKVLVEEEAIADRRVTSVVSQRSAFGRSGAWGTAETDRGIFLPRRYWFATGRDPQLEARVARIIESRL
jgi:hypothetical protein